MDCIATFADYNSVFEICMRRIRCWKHPPNYAASDWFDEMSGELGAAACQALRDYDAARQVPLSAFVYQRMLAGALSRYRKEWSFALRHGSHTGFQPQSPISDSARVLRLDLRRALGGLSPLEIAILRQLYWEGHTESQAAERLEISQQAVNKRKRILLRRLRGSLAAPAIKSHGAGCRIERFPHFLMQKGSG